MALATFSLKSASVLAKVMAVGNPEATSLAKVGPDNTIYSFNGIAGTVVAIDGDSGKVKWRRQYNEVARQHLPWRPFLERVSTVDGIITVTDTGLWTFFDLNYVLPGGEQDFPQPHKIVVVQLNAANGNVLSWFEARDASGAFVIPDRHGYQYLSLSGTATSISYYGVNPQLPSFLRSDLKPEAGLVVMKPAQAEP